MSSAGMDWRSSCEATRPNRLPSSPPSPPSSSCLSTTPSGRSSPWSNEPSRRYRLLSGRCTPGWVVPPSRPSTFTYGDSNQRAKQILEHIGPGDVVVFYGGLRDVQGAPGLVYAIIGFFEVAE